MKNYCCNMLFLFLVLVCVYKSLLPVQVQIKVSKGKFNTFNRFKGFKKMILSTCILKQKI